MPWLSERSHPLPEEDLISWTFDHCDYDKDKPIYIKLDDPSRSLSWKQSRTLVRQLVAGFHAAGLQEDDCVLIASFNDILYAMLFLGLIGAGDIFTGCNPAYTPFEIRHHGKTAKVRFIVAEPELLPNVLEGSEGLVRREDVFVFDVRGGRVPEGMRGWRWLLGWGERDWRRFGGREVCRGTAAARLTTSGMMGPPKMAVQSHWNGTSWFTMVSEISVPEWEIRNLFPLPMFHVATVPVVHCGPLRRGNVAYIMHRFDLGPFLSAVETHRITLLGFVPPLVLAIINSPLRHKYSLKSVRRVGCGAAPLDRESGEKLKALCAEDCTFTQVLESTETTGVFTLFYYPDEDETGSVGNTWVPNSNVKLIDDDGNDITDYDVRGELCVRGPSIIDGYFDNTKANAESWDSEGYYKTGDVVYCDGKTKKWYIVDRKKELIKIRGLQVSAPELEGIILSLPDVVDVAIIGLPAPKNSDAEQPRAYVVRRPGSKVTEADVKDVVRKTLASYKQLTGGVVFVEELPKSPSGKILKRVLRERVDGKANVAAKL